MPEKEKVKTVKIVCKKCGGNSPNHLILNELDDGWEDDNNGLWAVTTHQILKCQGCDTIRFRTYYVFSENYDPETGSLEITEKGLYPDESLSKRMPVDTRFFPKDVEKIYLETITSFNAGALILTGGGLRATVEAICIERGVKDNNLQKKIDSLVTQGFLAKAQADLLHEERYLGNTALHQMKTPSKSDLEDGLKIIEVVMEAIYVLPRSAARLKESRKPNKE